MKNNVKENEEKQKQKQKAKEKQQHQYLESSDSFTQVLRTLNFPDSDQARLVQ